MGQKEDEKYARVRAERQKHVEAVLQSRSKRRVVAAGAGTGKTFLFKEILKTNKKALTLTFVNSLVEDLSLDLRGLSEVKTLHAFARGVMGKASPTAKVYPRLSKVIEEDARILAGAIVDYDSLFQNRDDENANVAFYKSRRKFYGYYGFTDIIYAAVLYLEQNKNKIPALDVVLVDEFQDFNKLEVSLIDLLAGASPIVIAGDDDQSLYFFKSASPDYLRDRYSDKNADYASFNLPHCSRCTRVIVEAVNDIVKSAQAEGFLKGRINKPYVYFDDPKKDEECGRYPTIDRVICYANQFPFFIDKTIKQIADERREKFSVLVIAPTNARCAKIAHSLEEKGYRNVQIDERDRGTEPTLLDALNLLRQDASCNLGWRVAARVVLPEANFAEFLEKTRDEKQSTADVLDAEKKKWIKSLLSTFKKVANGETISHDDSDQLLAALRIDPHLVAQKQLQASILESEAISDPAVRNMPIKITTIPSSKGLADDYIFISDFDDHLFLDEGNKCSDRRIYDFIVALTRARRKVFLMSSQKETPKFLSWIAQERVNQIGL